MDTYQKNHLGSFDLCFQITNDVRFFSDLELAIVQIYVLVSISGTLYTLLLCRKVPLSKQKSEIQQK